MDNKKLRKINFQKNQAKPIVPEESKGSLGDRDPQTGRYKTKLDNGGSYLAKPLFKSSVNSTTPVQLNEATRTADYRSSEPDKQKLKGNVPKDRSPQLATANFEVERDDTGEVDRDNPVFGNCNVCGGERFVNLNCNSGNALITFSDGTTQEILTPAELEYGVKVTFSRTNGSGGELVANTCATLAVFDGVESTESATDATVYGELIYAKPAGSAFIGGLSVADIKEFHLYQQECSVTLVAIAVDGTRTAVGQTTCDNLTGTYTPIVESVCVELAGQRVCGVNPDTITPYCSIRGYRLCQKWRVQWTKLSTGKVASLEDCGRLWTAIANEPFSGGESPGANLDESFVLKYDSKIPRFFTVNVGELSYGSGDFAYFQIYQNPASPCQYKIVGVKVLNPIETALNPETNKVYETIYTGACGFEIVLGGTLLQPVLKVYDEKDNLLLSTPDFIADTVSVSQSGQVERVLVFEKTSSPDVEGFGILDVSCVSV